MNKKVLRLYPTPGHTEPLRGLYLRGTGLVAHNRAEPHIYANFLSSLDGRIAISETAAVACQLPAALKSDEDFNLLLELYAHSDCIITHAGYMRALARDELGNVLQMPQGEDYQYLHDWRQQQGLKPQPDVLILTGSLDFPWHASLDQHQQQVHIVTAGKASSAALAHWQEQGRSVHVLGDQYHVDVHLLVTFLQQQCYRSVYLMAGPDLLQDLLAGQYVDRFFMTLSHQLMGGEHYKSLLSGDLLGDNGHLQLVSLYQDEADCNSLGQWYAEFTFKNKE